MKIIECVPNFSEGQDHIIIKEIADSMEAIPGVTLLDVDSGADTNRTVITIVGNPDAVISSAFSGIAAATKLINMNKHTGAHPRMGSTDVCPFVPVSNVTMDDCVNYSNRLAKMVGDKLKIPIFLYEYSANKIYKKNLAEIRKGEYEGMSSKLKLSEWKPDYGPSNPHMTAGVTAIGARNFLIAYNINLNTKDKKIATDISLDIREQGRNKRDKNGKFIRNNKGIPIKAPGLLKSCKAVGWYIEEYGVAQVSMNLTDFNDTSPHAAFEEVRKQASKRGTRVTGSELVGLIPLESIIAAGKYFLKKQKRSTGMPIKDIIHIAVKSMGLDELYPFNPNEKIIEYRIKNSLDRLARMQINDFADELSSDSPAPGGGSVSALVGALGAALVAMVANLTFGKKKWEPNYKEMCKISEDSQILKYKLLKLIDSDTVAFNNVLDAYRMPDKSKKQKACKDKAILKAMKEAVNIPFDIMQCCYEALQSASQVVKNGNSNAISDAGVAAEIAYSALRGAVLNIEINLKDIDESKYCDDKRKTLSKTLLNAEQKLINIRKIVSKKINA
tara:strand:- start:15 stop:1688 length:1674 start_codon:yes stop_codon:yes gene_type:complete